jgi:hypothetical protein
MGNEKLMKNWHAAIMQQCRQKLGRPLTPLEEKFITSRGAFVALEMIEDTVRSLSGPELEAYLNSESAQ